MRPDFLTYFFLLITLSYNVLGQKLNEPSIHFDHLYTPGSIKFNNIYDVTEDDMGFKWFACNNGIYRYDGYEMANLNDFVNSAELSHKPITSILSQPEGIIYASLQNYKGLLKIQNDFSNPHLIKGDLTNFRIHELFSFNNKVGFLSRDNGLFLVNEKNQTVDTIYQDKVFSFYEEGSKWYVGAKDRLLFFENGELVRTYQLPQLKGNPVQSISKYKQSLLISTKKDIIEFHPKTEELIQVNFNIPGNETINETHVDSKGRIWILTRLKGVFILDNDIQYHYDKNPYKEGTLSHNTALSFYECQDNIIWIGTASGINIYDPQKRHFSLLGHDPTNVNSLSNALVRGVFENSNEELFIGTDDGTINILNKEREKIRHIKMPSEEGQRTVPFYFLEDSLKKGNYFVCSTNGLYSLDLENQKFNKLAAPEFRGSKRVRQIMPFDKDRLLCLSSGNIWLYNVAKNQPEEIEAHPSDHLNTLKGGARKLYKDPYDNLIVGGLGEVALYDPLKNRFTSRKIYSVTEEGDSSSHMVLFVKRYDEKLFIGTFQGGLFTLDLDNNFSLNGKLTRYSQQDGLPDNTIYGILRDDEGRFWLSTNNGISRFDLKNRKFFNFLKGNGLQAEEFNRLSYTKTKRGEMVFGGIEGLNIFFPEKVKPSQTLKYNPLLVNVDIINQFKENGKLVNPQYSLLRKEEIELGPDQNYLTFKFASNNYSQPERSRFYYKLDNYDSEWIFSEEPNATYTGLKPGSYSFMLKTVGPDGEISPESASVGIIISTVWWKTWWAGLLFGGVIFGFVSISLRRSVKRNRAIKSFLELEIHRRTKELKNSKEELAMLNKKKDFIFSILSHDLRSPLTTLKGFLGILVDHFDTLDEKDIKTHAVNIKNSVAKSLDLLDNTLFWSLSQMGDIKFSPSKVSINTLFEKIIGLYDLTAKKKGVHLAIIIEESINVYADENMTYITLRNLVSNAIKFTPSGKNIYLSAYVEDDHAVIRVEDEGNGIRPENLSKLFDQNHNYMQKGTSNEKGTGLGLILCKKFTDMNGGVISVQSKENFGTTFTVSLKLYQEEYKPIQE